MSDYDSLIGEAKVAARLTANGYERDVLTRLADALEAVEARGHLQWGVRYNGEGVVDVARDEREARQWVGPPRPGRPQLVFRRVLPWEPPSEGGN